MLRLSNGLKWTAGMQLRLPFRPRSFDRAVMRASDAESGLSRIARLKSTGPAAAFNCNNRDTKAR